MTKRRVGVPKYVAAAGSLYQDPPHAPAVPLIQNHADALHQRAADVASIADRMHALATRLLGSVGADGDEQAIKAPLPSHSLARLEQGHASLNDAITSAGQAIERLETL